MYVVLVKVASFYLAPFLYSLQYISLCTSRHNAEKNQTQVWFVEISLVLLLTEFALRPFDIGKRYVLKLSIQLLHLLLKLQLVLSLYDDNYTLSLFYLRQK